MLTVLVATGFECGLHDLKHSTVPNRWLLLAFASAIILNGSYYVLVASDYVVPWIQNMLLADTLAVAMYCVGLWAAGDVKLFALLYLCVPGRLLDTGTLSCAVIPYIYVFVPALLWLLADTLWQMLHHVRAYHVRIQWKSMLIHWLVILLESSALRRMLLLIIPEFYRENELLCAAVMIVYAFVCNTYPVMRRWPVITIHAIILLVTFFLQPMQVSFGAWWNYVAVILVLLFQHWAGQYNYRAIPTSAVQQGMILSADTILRFSRSRVHGLPNDASESMTARLTDIQAAAVKRWESSANGAVEITIVRKMPFAILISIGFFLWMMIRIVR